MSDNPFNPELWQPVKGFTDLTDITYHRHVLDGVAKPTVRVAFNRPEVRNAFRPHSVDEMVGGRFVPVAISASAVAAAISTPTGRPPTPWMPPGPAGCTSSRCNG